MTAFPKDRPKPPKPFWLKDNPVYVYYPPEFYRGLSPHRSPEDPSLSPDRENSPHNDVVQNSQTWHLLVIALLTALTGILTFVGTPRVTEALSFQTRGAVSQLGIPTSWRF
jgi:hypothetical protein